eukprot:TRINITY_DN484_c0_g1_i1.p1 TRINITY_DN484_c0_g1~~TRINITY_DN484_c0_g1_i1.p1  ORF type:complete len:390 (+),score=67.19 TRINITY_DN484_c0_g1_i1:185-1354(+)
MDPTCRTPFYVLPNTRAPLASLSQPEVAGNSCGVHRCESPTSKRKRGADQNASGSASECSTGCNRCHEHIKELKDHITTLNRQLEAQMSAYVQAQVQTMVASAEAKMEAKIDTMVEARVQAKFASSIVEERPKKVKKGRMPDRCCFVCGGQEGPVLNRQLGVVLDDRCRKQVDVIKHGGKVNERKELWERAIVHVHTSAARMIAEKLKVESVNPSDHVTSCPQKLAGEPCAVCMEPMGLGARVQTLECGSQHTFHHECIGWWLVESATCPLCREDLSGQCAGHQGQFVENPLARPSVPAQCSNNDLPFNLVDFLDSDACASILDNSWEMPAAAGQPPLPGGCTAPQLDPGGVMFAQRMVREQEEAEAMMKVLDVPSCSVSPIVPSAVNY